MQDYELSNDEVQPCHDCEYWKDLIDRTNQELAALRQPLGLCSIPETVRHLNADPANPEPSEQRRALEEKLQGRVKTFTLSQLKHQEEAHREST
jgi:hypothetical protein